MLEDALTAVVSAIKLQAAPRLELPPATTAALRATFPVTAVPPPRPSRATSAARKATSPEIALKQATLRVAVGATAAEEVLAPSATSVARLAILLVRALKPPLEEEEEATARSVVVVDLKRPAILAVV